MSRKRRLRIVRAGEVGIAPEVAADLAARLRDRLDLRVAVEARSFLADAENRGGGDGSRADVVGPEGRGATEQSPVSSNQIVDALAAGAAGDDDGWVLALTAHDLTAPGRSFVFGEAAQGGRWAVVSVARFGPPDATSPRMLERLYKEAVHELGHLAGLDHCSSSEPCVMELSSTVSAIDAKNSEFCARCLAQFSRKQVEG